jgi:DNA-directed RNA polymerase subunit RPC12/RpoP
MKGRTSCPKCKHEFVLGLPDDNNKHEISCPNCKSKFVIQAKCADNEKGEECSWEEHGEPRKTILSKLKPKTNKPIMAIILLVIVFAIGLTTAIFSDVFIASTMDVASDLGLTGSIEIYVIDYESNNSIEGINITINDITGETDDKGVYSVENVELGILTVKLSGSNYKTQTYEILITPFLNSDSTIMMEKGNGTVDKVNFDTVGCFIILTIFSIFSLVGVIACLKRQHIDVAVASSFLAIFSFGFFFFGSILSIIALVLIIRSKEEFENGKKGKIF